MFSIEMLPAKDSDCVWIEYGKPDEVHRVVIDGGPLGASDALRSRIETLPVADRNLELLVVTHIDSDHIAGIVKALSVSAGRTFYQTGLVQRLSAFGGRIPRSERSRVSDRLPAEDRGEAPGVGALHNETESAALRLIRNLTQFEASTTCVSRLALNPPPF
jgi:glyoxylase-like metal-dependent hydrolase (beta-lactamase superfamily II)